MEFSFEAESLTHFGGLFLIQRFCNKLCLRRRLERIAEHWEARRGELPSIRFSRSIRVPVARCRVLLGIDPEPEPDSPTAEVVSIHGHSAG